ncbi:ilGF domain-containing protein [Trichonephila clavata]|uniref:IlGF domain-containing protein n=1 Tax=Trichonephila clavata TaxID=2740835 RepID=A0A8X6KU09_TRICU|nr:ilGF domain-containing protein [Trichonephila clavata]
MDSGVGISKGDGSIPDIDSLHLHLTEPLKETSRAVEVFAFVILDTDLHVFGMVIGTGYINSDLGQWTDINSSSSISWALLHSPTTMLIFLLFLTVWSVSEVSEGSTLLDPKRIMKRGDIRVCGRMLTDTLSLLCNGEYYDPSEDRAGKRDLPPAILDPYQGWFGIALSSRPRSEDGPQSILDQLPTPQVYKRYQPGVVDECCRKACSLSTLLSYCRRVD